MNEPTTIDLMIMWLHDSENDLYDHSTNDRMKEKIKAALIELRDMEVPPNYGWDRKEPNDRTSD